MQSEQIPHFHSWQIQTSRTFIDIVVTSSNQNQKRSCQSEPPHKVFSKYPIQNTSLVAFELKKNHSPSINQEIISSEHEQYTNLFIKFNKFYLNTLFNEYNRFNARNLLFLFHFSGLIKNKEDVENISYIYTPMQFHSNESKGYAFIYFKTTEFAEEFKSNIKFLQKNNQLSIIKKFDRAKYLNPIDNNSINKFKRIKNPSKEIFEQQQYEINSLAPSRRTYRTPLRNRYAF